LASNGVGQGDRVAIMLPNSIVYFEVWAAAAQLGASVVLVNWHLKRDELDYILTDSAARVLVADASLRDAYEGVSCPVLVAGDELERLLAAEPATPPPFTATVLASPVFYTSGTTGRPKGVVHATF